MKFWIIIAILVLISFAGNYFRWAYDDTDDYRPGKTFGKRSGLSLYTDHATGVQYVKAGLFGDITPRLDKDGKPIASK